MTEKDKDNKTTDISDTKQKSSESSNGVSNGAGKPDLQLSGRVVLYKNPEPLSFDKHKGMGIKRPEKPLSFLHETHLIPVTAGEFALAASQYAIIFVGDNKLPMAAVGVAPGTNEFIDAQGNMKPETYIPAFARRYPFIMAQTDEKERMVLCFDRDGPMISDDPDVPFFDDEGKNTQFMDDTLKFCTEFEQHRIRTEAFVKKLDDMDLFEKREEKFNVVIEEGKEAKNAKIADYWAVSPKKLDELSDDKYLELRKMNAIGAIYSHLTSLQNWRHMMRRASDRMNGSSSGISTSGLETDEANKPLI